MKLLIELLSLVEAKSWTPKQWAESLLQAYIEKRVIWKEAGFYVGRAADGEVVQLGEVGKEENLEQYLKSRRPQDW